MSNVTTNATMNVSFLEINKGAIINATPYLTTSYT